MCAPDFAKAPDFEQCYLHHTMSIASLLELWPLTPSPLSRGGVLSKNLDTFKVVLKRQKSNVDFAQLAPGHTLHQFSYFHNITLSCIHIVLLAN